MLGVVEPGFVVLDLLCREPSIDRIVLLDPDVYKSHNVHRHYFGNNEVGRLKAELAADWIRRFRPELDVETLPIDLMDLERQGEIDAAVASCDLGVCAVDNEPAKYAFDALMRKHLKPWTLGEVLSGGIGGWVHSFRPAEACYLVLRGALEVFIRSKEKERRVAIAGPGKLVGFMAVITGAARANNARVREACCLLEIPRGAFLDIYNGGSGATVNLHHAIHRSLMRSLARTNTQLTRLISHARLNAATQRVDELEAALHGQLWRAEGEQAGR